MLDDGGRELSDAYELGANVEAVPPYDLVVATLIGTTLRESQHEVIGDFE
jgi:hypothetical protein